MTLKNPILRLAIPSVISNITVPLLSMVDMSVVGHMDDSCNIGGIYIGTTIFNMIYWIFAFLRMGTTGIVSQAYGANDQDRISYGLFRSLLLGLGISLFLLIFQTPILWLTLKFIDSPDSHAIPYAEIYYRVCIWGAPAVLAGYSLSGWFIGMHDTRTPMIMAILQNVVNIFMSLLFVYGLKTGIAGVAGGTVIGIYCGVMFGISRLRNRLSQQVTITYYKLINKKELSQFIKVNRDIFLRTICLVIVTMSFTKFSALLGENLLAANAIAMQFFILYSYFMDGLANAAEALSGECAGQNDRNRLDEMKQKLFRMASLWSVCFILIYLFAGHYIINILTDSDTVRQSSYIIVRQWIWMVPICAMSAFIWDGVFIGLTWSRGMLFATLFGSCTFFIVYYSLCFGGNLNNNYLWIAFLLYLAVRGLTQWIIWKKKSTSKSWS